MPSSACQTCALRSEEHTSELQSLTNLVCRLLLEKKLNANINNDIEISRDGGTGRRRGLKILRSQGHESSILSPGILIKVNRITFRLLLRRQLVFYKTRLPL